MADRQRKHGAVRVCFTCDEEIGRGVGPHRHPTAGAAACYTLDGQAPDHRRGDVFRRPGDRHDSRQGTSTLRLPRGKMVNAVRLPAISWPASPRDRQRTEVDRRSGGLPASLRDGRRSGRGRAAENPAPRILARRPLRPCGRSAERRRRPPEQCPALSSTSRSRSSTAIWARGWASRGSPVRRAALEKLGFQAELAIVAAAPTARV